MDAPDEMNPGHRVLRERSGLGCDDVRRLTQRGEVRDQWERVVTGQHG